jgi:hypothetical protein
MFMRDGIIQDYMYTNSCKQTHEKINTSVRIDNLDMTLKHLSVAWNIDRNPEQI